ncbi:hypothetical protein FACS1894208_10500 [Clostridia bacterium]|nr:hypothetical protein FACS1894208_10500 [Clostridia bacterium]
MNPTIKNLIETLKDYECCEWCGEDFVLENGTLTCDCDDSDTLSFEEICKDAGKLPPDYCNRAVRGKLMFKETINGDLWVTNGFIAENISDSAWKYPDIDNLASTTALRRAFDYAIDYEIARISKMVYRQFGRYIAVLESDSNTVYIDDELLNRFSYCEIQVGKPNAPVLFYSDGKRIGVAMPTKFNVKNARGC